MTGKTPKEPHRPAKEKRGESGISEEGPYNAGLAVFSYIVGGIIVWTLIGWSLDNLFGTGWIVLAGAFLGAAGGFYLAYTHGLTRQIKKNSDGPASNADSAERPLQ